MDKYIPLTARVAILNGQTFFRYEDSCLVFSIVNKCLFAFDVDDTSVNVFKDGNFFEVLKDHGISREEFESDFGNKGLTLSSSNLVHELDI